MFATHKVVAVLRVSPLAYRPYRDRTLVTVSIRKVLRVDHHVSCAPASYTIGGFHLSNFVLRMKALSECESFLVVLALSAPSSCEV